MQQYQDKDYLFFRHQELKDLISKTLTDMAVLSNWINDTSVDIKAIQQTLSNSGRLGTQISNNARKIIIKRHGRIKEVQQEIDMALDIAISQKELLTSLSECIKDESKKHVGINSFVEKVPRINNDPEYLQAGIDLLNGKNTSFSYKAASVFKAIKRSVFSSSSRSYDAKTAKEQVQKYVTYFYTKFEDVPLSISLIDEFQSVNGIKENSTKSFDFENLVLNNVVKDSSAIATCEEFVAFLKYKATNTLTRLKVKHSDEKQKFSALTRDLEAKRFYMNRVKSSKYWAEKLFDMGQYQTNDINSIIDLLNLARDLNIEDLNSHITRCCYFLFPDLDATEKGIGEVYKTVKSLKRVTLKDLQFIETRFRKT